MSMGDGEGQSGCGVASYISELTAELARMAELEGLSELNLLLKMVWLESERLCGRDFAQLRGMPHVGMLM